MRFCPNQITGLLAALALALPAAAGPVHAKDPTLRPQDETKSLNILDKRVANNDPPPVDVEFDVGSWQDIAEENCYIMLCLLGGQRNYRRQPNAEAAEDAYTNSGAKAAPFRGKTPDRKGTTRIGDDTTSAEEFPWRSIQIDESRGEKRYLVSATTSDQHSQGGSIRHNYDGAGVDYGHRFRIKNFLNRRQDGKFCNVLFDGHPPASQVCNPQTTETMFNIRNIALYSFVYFVVRNDKGMTFKHGLPPGSKRSIPVGNITVDGELAR